MFGIKEFFRINKDEPAHDKTRKMICAPSEDSDLIRVYAVRMKKPRVLNYPLNAQRRLWSDWADAQADLSPRWEHRSFCFCHAASHFILLKSFISGTVMIYRKFPKYSDTQNICCSHSKIWTMWLYHRVMSSNDADGIANSVDPDQTVAPRGAVWSGSALFAQAYLSENLGSLR